MIINSLILGNGVSLLRAVPVEMGMFDEVIRFNDFVFEDKFGKRVDYWGVNTNLRLTKNRVQRTDVDKNICVVVIFAGNRSKERVVHQEYEDHGWRVLEGPNPVRRNGFTSGLSAIQWCLQRKTKVTIAGFDLCYDSGARCFHYYDIPAPGKHGGWGPHNPARERKQLLRWIEEGQVETIPTHR